MYTHISLSLYVCMYIYIYICIHLYLSLSLYIYIYIYIRTMNAWPFYPLGLKNPWGQAGTLPTTQPRVHSCSVRFRARGEP